MTRTLLSLIVPALLLFSPPAGAREQSRRVLALYDSSEPVANAPASTFVHRLLEMPLNHLGMAVDYHDVNAGGLPDLSPYRAVVVWFTDDTMRRPERFCRRLADALRGGTRLVAVGGLGAGQDHAGRETDRAAVREVYSLMGLDRDPEVGFTDNPFAVTYADHRPGRFQFETDLPPERPVYECVRATGESVDVWRSVRRTDVADSTGVAVAVGPWGGFALDPSCILRSFSRPSYHVRWDLDPFAFLEAALDCGDLPRPDVTTVLGARAAYSHIDGDGMANMSRDLAGPPRPGAEVVLDEALRRYPVPVTVGLIAGRVDPDALGGSDAVKLSRRILGLAHVQAGCHGYAHPLEWQKGTVALDIPGYRLELEKEISGAVAYLEREVLPDDGEVEVSQWSGDCEPPASALALCAGQGLPTINGEDSRYDALHESVFFVAPLSRPVGDHRQVNASACNEYIYTDRLTQNFGGFRNVIETFRRTNSPRRLLPVNVYYHFYSGERKASLRALKQVYEWCLDRPLCWLHAAEYVRAVEDFHRVRVGRTADGGRWVEDFGRCRTVRLDRCGRQVDLSSSAGVVGFTRHNGSLYVALAPGDRAEIYLCDHPPERPCVDRSPALLRGVESARARWRAQARLYAPGELRLKGFPAGETLRATVGKETRRVTADADGAVAIGLPPGSGEWVEVSVGR